MLGGGLRKHLLLVFQVQGISSGSMGWTTTSAGSSRSTGSLHRLLNMEWGGHLAGWLVTRMSRPHVICSITIYDPLILNHKKVIYGQDQDISFYAYCVHSHCSIPEARRLPALVLSQPGSGKMDSLILSAKTSVISWVGFLQLLWGTGAR